MSEAKAAGVSCEECNGLCCRYVAIEIDKPTGKRDYDHIRWYLLHANVSVFISHGGDWFVEFGTPCTELGDDYRCRIYDRRPRICSAHGDGDEICEFRTDEKPYKIRFDTVGAFEAHLDACGVDWRWRQPRSGR